MTAVQRADYVVRETIMKLLSNEEIATVSKAEAAPALTDGDEYLDLEHLDQGVQRANAKTKVTMGHVLPRRAVSTGTWSKILSQLAR